MISESTLTSEHYFLSMTQRYGKKTIYGRALSNNHLNSLLSDKVPFPLEGEKV